MKGNYRRIDDCKCHQDDLYLFEKMRNGKDRTIWVRKVEPGDIIVSPGNVIDRWRIIITEDGNLYLGYCEESEDPFENYDESAIYVVELNSKGKDKPYWALYRVPNNVYEIFRVLNDKKVK